MHRLAFSVEGLQSHDPIHAGPSGSSPTPRLRGRRRSLARYLAEHTDDILHDWDRFAAQLPHEGRTPDPAALRGHGAELVADLLEAVDPQGAPRPAARGDTRSAAQRHAEARRLAGFSVDSVVAEYRALRGSVLEGWCWAGGGGGARDLQDVLRFDEAIDAAMAESVRWCVQQTRSATDLFIGILGHDIRNPLGTILACADYFVQSGQLPAGATLPLKNAAWRIRAIVDQTLDFTRAQSHGTVPLRRTSCRLVEQIARVMHETQLRHPGRLLRLDGAAPLEGSWDEDRMAQVLSNLMANALHYGSRDGPVTVRTWESATEHCFAVHNLGVPIPPEEAQQIFEPLVRGHTAIAERRARSGLGLGLFICREVVRAHGGTITLRSNAAEGTTFTVRLPRPPESRSVG